MPDSARSSPLGRVVATERRPNTPHEFHFWTAVDSPVGIGTIVRVEGTRAVEGHIPRVYGVVVDGFSYAWGHPIRLRVRGQEAGGWRVRARDGYAGR